MMRFNHPRRRSRPSRLLNPVPWLAIAFVLTARQAAAQQDATTPAARSSAASASSAQGPADAAPPAAEEPTTFETVVVQGSRDAKRVDLSRLYLGVDRFLAEAGRPPGAMLKFATFDLAPESAKLQLRIEDDGAYMRLEMDSQGRFELPRRSAQASAEAQLVANRKSGSLRIRPLVDSLGRAPAARRLGDLRLECEVAWEIEKQDIPLLFRAAFGLAGGACSSDRVHMPFPSSRKITSATLSMGERSTSAWLAPDGSTFAVPLHDRSWPDEAVVELTFQATPGRP